MSIFRFFRPSVASSYPKGRPRTAAESVGDCSGSKGHRANNLYALVPKMFWTHVGKQALTLLVGFRWS
jgi:hypothetical protein